jgi:hypothetical protein
MTRSFDVRDSPQNKPVKENYAERQPGRTNYTVFFLYFKGDRLPDGKKRRKKG